MKSSKRSVKIAMRSRRSSKLHVMLGRFDIAEEGAWVVRREGRIVLLIESEDSNIVAIFMDGDGISALRDIIIVRNLRN